MSLLKPGLRFDETDFLDGVPPWKPSPEESLGNGEVPHIGLGIQKSPPIQELRQWSGIGRPILPIHAHNSVGPRVVGLLDPTPRPSGTTLH